MALRTTGAPSGSAAHAVTANPQSAMRERRTPMKNLTQYASRVLNALTLDLDCPYEENGSSSRKIENNPAFMAVCVERISWREYAVAHYYTRNGDLIADPEMVFVQASDDCWYPTTFEMGGQRYEQSVAVIAGRDGEISSYLESKQAEHVTFANRWLRNIDRQQKVLGEAAGR